MGAGRAQPRWAAVGAAPFASARAEAGGEGVKRGVGGALPWRGQQPGQAQTPVGQQCPHRETHAQKQTQAPVWLYSSLPCPPVLCIPREAAHGAA